MNLGGPAEERVVELTPLCVVHTDDATPRPPAPQQPIGWSGSHSVGGALDLRADIEQDPPVDQLDVNRVRATLEAALVPDASPGVAALVYARTRESARLLVAETRLAAEFEALFPAAYLELAAAPGYPDVLCRQLAAWLAEVDAAREARALTPELALVDDSLRDAPAELDGYEPPRVAAPRGVNTPVGVAAAAYFLRASARTLAVDVALLLALAALVLMLAVHP